MSLRMLTPLLIATALVVSTGCSTQLIDDDPVSDPDDPNPDDPTPDPQGCATETWQGTLEVGSGDVCFESVQPGQTVPLIAGPQFGFHVWFGLRCRDCERNETVSYAVKDADGNFVGGEALQAPVVMKRTDDGYRHTAGVRAFMPGDGFEDPSYLGDTFTLWAQMDIGGELVSDEVEVVIDGIAYMSSGCPDCN